MDPEAPREKLHMKMKAVIGVMLLQVWDAKDR